MRNLIVACAVLYAVFGVLLPTAFRTVDGGSTGSMAADDPPAMTNVEEGEGSLHYVRSQLGQDDQKKYDIVLESLQNRSALSYPSSDMDDLSHIRDCVLADHPELLGVTGMRMQTMNVGIIPTSADATVEGQYSYDEGTTESMMRELEAKAAACLADLPDDAGDYEAAKYLYEYLAEHVTYDQAAVSVFQLFDDSSEGQFAYDALVRRRAVCAGYSRAYQYLLQQLGIPCVYVSGTANGGRHAWCAVKLDGEWYYVDPTWGDPQHLDDFGNASDSGQVSYDYLCVTEEDLAHDHVADTVFPLPACTATADNYYVHEGLFVDGADIEAVGGIVRAAREEGDAQVSFRCANAAVFEEVTAALFEQGKVHEYLDSSNCTYSTDSVLHTVRITL